MKTEAVPDSNSTSRSESGQALVEYILVLVVVVGICGGALYQFNDAFANYAKAFFSGYLACLIDLGELPALGGADTTEGQCSVSQFNLGKGRTLTGIGNSNNGTTSPNTSANGGNSSGAKGGSANTGKNGGKTSAAPPAAVHTADSGAGARGSRGNAGFQSPFGSGAKKIPVGAAKNSESDNPGGSLEALRLADGSSGRRPKLEGRIVASYSLAPEQIEHETEPGGKKSALGRKTDKALKQSRIRLEPTLPKKMSGLDTDEGLSLGAWLRWILIIGILIVLIVFIGSQIMNAMRSIEKN